MVHFTACPICKAYLKVLHGACSFLFGPLKYLVLIIGDFVFTPLFFVVVVCKCQVRNHGNPQESIFAPAPLVSPILIVTVWFYCRTISPPPLVVIEWAEVGIQPCSSFLKSKAPPYVW